MKPGHYHIELQPVGRRGDCPAGRSLLDCARDLGVDLASLCGGSGHCGRCRLQVLSGLVSKITSVEEEHLSAREIEDGWRLACSTFPESDCLLLVPPESLTTPQRTQVEGIEVPAVPEPPVALREVRVPLPSLKDTRGDAERLLEALNLEHSIDAAITDPEVLRRVPAALRGAGGMVHAAVRDGEIIALYPDPPAPSGLAVDLGTTKIAGYLVDLETGRTLASGGIMNPQVAYGEDVISRLARVRRTPEEGARMQGMAVEAINGLCRGLCTEAGRTVDSVLEAVVVGNTAMHHLLLRLPVERLIVSPFVPAVSGALDIRARDLGLDLAPGAYVHLPPNIAGFLGGDHSAMLLATRALRAEGVVLALDIGTNTEVCLSRDGRMTSVSCASGPAFEGAHIRHGMRAAEGAIERVRIEGDRVEYQTIGNAPPAGLCGSGILDALAQLLKAGILDPTGRLRDHPLVRTVEGRREFVLVEEDAGEGRTAITVTQKDVRELQLAKGAIRTGIRALLETEGLKEGDIDRVIMAGAFGSYIDLSSAITVGMLPLLPPERFRQVGNAAGTGARLALISRSERAKAVDLVRRVRSLELSTLPRFQEIFIESMSLGR